VLFGHKITLYRFNQGAHTIAWGSNQSRGLNPLPLTTLTLTTEAYSKLGVTTNIQRES